LEEFAGGVGFSVEVEFAYHPQTDEQSERTIQSLEDLLRVCVFEQGELGIVIFH